MRARAPAHSQNKEEKECVCVREMELSCFRLLCLSACPSVVRRLLSGARAIRSTLWWLARKIPSHRALLMSSRRCPSHPTPHMPAHKHALTREPVCKKKHHANGHQECSSSLASNAADEFERCPCIGRQYAEIDRHDAWKKRFHNSEFAFLTSFL